MIDGTVTGCCGISGTVKTNLILSKDLYPSLIFMCIQRLFAVVISVASAVMHQKKSLLNIAIS